jgi:cytidylate kinase
MIIAIDGPAGAGKSTVAREVARALGLVYLDTGAMYRAVTLSVLAQAIDPDDGEACGRLARELDLTFDQQGRIRIDGAAGEPAIRGPGVNAAVPPAAVVAKQRRLAERGGLVAEGRDTTTVVFPAADHKFFLTASETERARRRARELGREQALERVRTEIGRRDRLDSTREHSPLQRAPDAVLVETDGLDVRAVVDRILSVVRGDGRT